MINEEAARLHRAEGAVAAQGDLAQIVVGADATDDDLRILGRLGRVDRDRAVLRDRYFQADVGITGANFLIAETGATVIVTNEGNGDLTQSLPKKIGRAHV